MKTVTRLSIVFALLVMLIVAVMPVMAHPTETSRVGDITPTPTSELVIDNDTSQPVTPDAPPDNPGDVIAFILWLTANGLSLVATLEKLPQFQKLTAEWKTILVFAVVVFVVPVGGDLLVQGLRSLEPTVLATINHYFFLVTSGWYTWSASQYGLPLFKQLTAIAKGKKA